MHPQITPELARTRYPNGVIPAKVVLVNGFQPANIIVRVRHQVDIDFARNDSRRSVVGNELRFRTQNSPQEDSEEEDDDRHS